MRDDTSLYGRGAESPRADGSLRGWRSPPVREINLGLRANAGQFALLVGVSALVGGMVGQERAIVPLLAVDVFGLSTATAALSFLVAFGLTKALTDLVAGALADRVGRKPVLVAGWLVGLPVPFLLIAAPDWAWVVAANVLLGVNQGLTWSTTVLMKIDLVGPRRRGLALGLNEASGYLAVAVVAFLTGVDRPIGRASAGAVLPGHRHRGSRSRASRSCSFARHVATPSTKAGRRPARAPVAEAPWLALAWRSTISDPVVVRRLTGRARQQPQRRDGLGSSADRLGGRRPRPRPDRLPRGGLPGDVGSHAGRDGRAVGPVGPQAPDRGRAC